MLPRDSARRVDGRRTRWAGQHERRRADFVEAALVAIERHGPEVSTEQIAEQAGVARTRLYKHFTDAGDLQRAIALRAAELITADLEPVWNPEQGSPMAMITSAVGTHLRWLTEHSSLYRYLSRHPATDALGHGDAVADIRTTIGVHLSRLFTDYLTAFDLDPRTAEPLAFGMVGFVESATSRWLAHPGDVTGEELTGHLARWIWSVLNDSLTGGGVDLDPHQPLPAPLELGGDPLP